MQGSRNKIRIIYKKSPSGKTKVHLKRRKSHKASCALCGRKLQGVSQNRKLSKSEKRPSAIFAGVLCSECRTTVIEEAIKIKEGIKSMEDSEIKYRKYIKEALNLLQ